MSTTAEAIGKLQEISRRLRYRVIEMIAQAKSGHPGGSLSAADIVTALYFHQMHYNPQNPLWPERDRFIMSKGHAAPLLYAAFAEAGFIPEEELPTLRKLGSRLQGHPDMKRLPGIEVSTGSLGHGLAVANGIALAGKLDNKNYRVYVLLGDGEIDEGEVWEAAMASSHYKLDNLTAILDRNGLQIDGPTEEVMALNPLPNKWKAFGWNVLEIDGHDFAQILSALKSSQESKGKPTIIIAYTIKGKGVSFMENAVDFHGRPLSPQEAEIALTELMTR